VVFKCIGLAVSCGGGVGDMLCAWRHHRDGHFRFPLASQL
jgi:hypothetical protein